ncbi:MAG: heparinase II/III family protein [Clostridia bacterium]|nr:heparinase II/III family protein [Clostridia bacterium]
MLITEKQFYTEELDTSIPELAKAKELFLEGKTAEAEHAFAEYFKSALDTEKFFAYVNKEIHMGGSITDASCSLIENADRICRGMVRSCSYTHDFGGEIDWNFNGTPDGYREWLWQLNRHHIFKIIAYAYLETGDEKYADAFNRHITGWFEQAPCPGWPVPNRCSKYPTWRTITAGIRQSGNWPYAIHAFLGSRSIPDSTWVKIGMSIWEHAEFLMNSPSSLNWLDIEMSGLNAIGTIYRFYKKSDEWRNFAVNMAASELKTQVYEDGFQCELTTGYQSVVITTNLSIYNLARHYGLSIPEDFSNNIRLLYTMYPKLMRPDGKTPCTNDGGQPDVAERMAHALKHFPDDPLFTAVLEGRVSEVYPRDIVMPYSGMITMRTGWGPEDIWLFFESAPFGAGHQHDDKLNINLSAYGKNLLNVIGNFAYDGSAMRKLCVITRGHNTALVDGKGQNARPTHTPWSPEKVNIKSDLEVNINEATVVAYGKYDRGYGGDLIPVTHERKVVFFREGIDGSKPFFVLLDDFTSNDENKHKYELNFIPPTAPVSVCGRHATVNAGDGVTLEIVTHAGLGVTVGATAPEYMGFRPSKDRLASEHTPSPFITVHDYGECAHLATVLYPTPDGISPEIGVSCDAESFTIVLDGKEHKFQRDEEFLVTKPV